MNERKLFQNGITLIALVVTIVVLLILAGVSLNATIGDNGIITQAQNAKYTQGIATLEEYLQEKFGKDKKVLDALFKVAKEQGASKEVLEIIHKCSNVVYDFQMNSDFSKVDDELEHANELMED